MKSSQSGNYMLLVTKSLSRHSNILEYIPSGHAWKSIVCAQKTFLLWTAVQKLTHLKRPLLQLVSDISTADFSVIFLSLLVVKSWLV